MSSSAQPNAAVISRKSRKQAKLLRFAPLFDTSLLRQLIAEHPKKPTLLDLARSIGKTHPTVAKYIAGHDVPLSMALKLRDVIAPTYSIEDLWRVS